jgi:hypothetical protein
MTTKTERAYMPHIWIQQTGIGPEVKIWAGEIVDRSGHPYRGVRFARLTKPGFDELIAQLQGDIRALKGDTA